MKINRRKFLKTTAIASASIPFFNSQGMALFIEAGGELAKIFASPGDDYKAGCYWWWFNVLVDKEGITRDLEEFKQKGIYHVFLINTKGGLGGADFPQGAKLFSQEWEELYTHTISEATRLGLEIGVNMSSGWCMGGPWIKPEDSGRWFLQSKLTVEGPQKFDGPLPLPGNRDGYDNVFNPPGFDKYINLPLTALDYRDTSIVAIPDNDGDAAKLLGERGGNILFSKSNRWDFSSHAKANVVLAPTLKPYLELPGDQPIPIEKVIDLNSKIGPDGKLKWDVPPGKWTIIRTGHRMTGSKLLIAQPEADGLSVDWFESKPVDIQFENFAKPFQELALKVNKNTLKYFGEDSFEDGYPNWTSNIINYFKEYRGYDPTPYLPVFAGYIVGSAEISDRFLHDYRKTVADCMADKHYQYLAEVCHKNGLLVQNESAGPSRSGSICMDGMKNLGKSDYPMGEFWLGPKHDEEGGLDPKLAYAATRLENGQNKVTKMVASAAHIYGKETVSAEAFTSHRHWKDSPGMLKQALDRAFCEGVNRIFLHTATASRPRDGKPGYEYGAGTHFNPNVTWWDKSKPFFDYVARCQYLLRAGKFVADVLYYNGDWAPNIVLPKHIDPNLGKGFDYDVCNEEVLLTRLSVKNNLIVLPDGMSYRLLVLPDTTKMPLPVLKKIEELVRKGATIIGAKPKTDPGLFSYPKCDEQVENLANKIWGNVDGKKIKQRIYGNGRIFTNESLHHILKLDGIVADFLYNGQDFNLDYIHRTTAEAEIYFVSNLKNSKAKTYCSFRIADRTAEIWDPVDGAMLTNPITSVKEGRTLIELEFDVFQSYFIIFPKKATVKQLVTKNWAIQNSSQLKRIQSIAGPWKVAFDPNWGGPALVNFEKLTDWATHTDERIKYYAGKAVYEHTFKLDFNKNAAKNLFLDLGEVKNIAEVWLNGESLGIVWTAPWRVDISKTVKNGNNDLKIEVINLWPNRLIGDADKPKEKRLTNTNIVFKSTDPLLPSGLLGPVEILSL
jgi:hypothetical protein